jgi:hypothetical protein
MTPGTRPQAANPARPAVDPDDSPRGPQVACRAAGRHET